MRKYSDILIINIITLIVGVVCYYFLDKKVEILTAVLAIGISISLGIRQYKVENDKMFKELFTTFNQAYDSKFNDKLKGIVDSSNLNPSYVLTSVESSLVIDYLNLCAEEYLWFKKGRIDEKVWLAWESGMVFYFNNTAINNFIQSEKEQEDSYYGLFSKISKKIQNW